MPARLAHFGLTLLRVERLLKLERPWFYGKPDADNSWGEGRVDDDIEGQVIHIDRFGNLICNIRQEGVDGFLGQGVSISISGVQIPEISPHYSAVREGKPVALWNSWGYLEIAIRNGSATRHLRARNGDRVQVKLRR